MTIRPGDFWVADILFTDQTSSKKRPVLVLWLDGADAVVAAVEPGSRIGSALLAPLERLTSCPRVALPSLRSCS
jgi:hypothetical protein